MNPKLLQTLTDAAGIDADGHPLTALPEVNGEGEIVKSSPIVYDSRDCRYWTGNSSNGWIKLEKSDVRLHLRRARFSSASLPGELSALDNELFRIQTEEDVAFAGPLAGYNAGLHTICRRKVLVTESPKPIEPKSGNCRAVCSIIDGLLGDEQAPYFYGWLKVSLEALHKRSRRPGQTVALAGPPGGGKSLVQNLITEIFGGRSAKPYQWMTGASNFNAEMFGAEHLMVEDEAASTDIRHRRHFGAFIKQITVNEEQSCHAKNRTPFMLTPFWRMTISLNDEPENLMVLPVLDESLVDKLMLFKTGIAQLPPTNTLEEFRAFRQTLSSQLPAFVHFVLQYCIPEHLVSQRFGVAHFHHPDLLEAINGLAPEKRLEEIIESVLFSPVTDTWTGTALQLEKRLRNSDFNSEVSKLLSWSNAAGTYLARLSAAAPDRYAKPLRHRGDWSRKWTITKGGSDA